ncbi:glycoside hydrolase family 97 protein [Paraflavitalea soli]|uniref:Glycoside hydrolase family 97 protein n=1 Tax=Paraflavitalea soli TaxID=2315862 RepID=A0A3B7MLD8_9BACT|nr:glycoside hydrolase family 97 protein [Paraflavitalea soli]AXY74109.1 glycoside hydrolase family 97 protein [Paraflavitalea soli]
MQKTHNNRSVFFTRQQLVLSSMLLAAAFTQAQTNQVASPDKNVTVTMQPAAGVLTWQVAHHGKLVIQPSPLGLQTATNNFTGPWRVDSASAVTEITDSYELFTGKKSRIQYKANKKTFYCSDATGKPLHIIYQVANDGIGFRYFLPAQTNDTIRVINELTSFTFDTTARAFLQPMQTAKTGFESTNPAYEDNYRQQVPVGAPSGTGWVYPALFKLQDTWVLLSEAGLDGTYCATRLKNEAKTPVYKIAFPDPRETMEPDGVLPRSAGPVYSPWRVVTIGSLKTIMESTLGTDLAPASTVRNRKFIQPGKASWSWIMSKDDSIVYSEQKRYVDYAADMKWQYCLIDANWDRNIGYDRIGELAAYARSKKVGLLLWYNSAGNWNTVKMTPKDKLLTHQSRSAEFALLKKMGIKGIKVDFFGGDGRSVIQYYIDILNDAAEAGLLVNFHGATLPRGWSRTYPHLITTEAVKGFEMITFSQRDADNEANHAAMLPYTRNIFDPMDFTPTNLYKIQSNVKRKTTSAFELATAVIYLSGIQHIAESPAGMAQVPAEVKNFLQQLPNRWDDVQFIEGFPGKYVVIARKAGRKWYIAGINGENTLRQLQLDLTAFKARKANLIADGNTQLDFTIEKKRPTDLKTITMQAAGGFVIIVE